jgi:hypothetical protein
LRQRAQWVCWRFEERNGNRAKVPINPHDGAFASIVDAATWATFGEACTAASAYDGIGFVFSDEDPFCGIDLDPTDDPVIRARQVKLYEHFNSYSERSPSGSGLHIIVRGNVPAGRRRDKIEVYSSARFFTMTGDVVNDAAISERQDLLSQLWHEMAPAGAAVSDASAFYRSATEADDAIYERAAGAANGDKFVRLWNGDGSDLPGSDKSGSAIDQALVNMLAFYTKNPAQIEQLWLRSPQGQRDKTRSRADYRASTIRRAFDNELPTMNFDGLAAQWRAVAESGKPALPAPVAPPGAWPVPSSIGGDEWLMSRSSPQAIVANLIYQDVGTIIAAGGTGKTTFVEWLAIHVALGIEFCGRAVLAPGRVVLLTAEDSREILVARLRKIAAAMFPHGTRTIEEHEAIMAAIRSSIIIVDVSANVLRLTCVERDVVRVDIAAVDALAASLGPLRPSLLLIDPAVSFGVGEARVNDAEQGLIEAARRLRQALACAVFFIHHTGKANARDQTEDQYSGRGGSALSDGSRMVFVINRPKPNDWAKQTGCPLAPGETGLKISLAKLSYCEPQGDLYVVRNGYAFRHLQAATQTDDDRERTEEETVLRFLSDELAKGIPHSQRTLGDLRERVGLSRDRLRSVVHRLLETSQLIEQGRDGGPVEKGKPIQLVPTTRAGSVGEGAA